jgi:hypothetical protein
MRIQGRNEMDQLIDDPKVHQRTLEKAMRRLDIQNRVIATLILLIVAAVLLGISRLVPPWLSWISNVSYGLITLGAAGIWVSYFAERQAYHSLKDSFEEITRGIDARFSVLKTTTEAKIEDLYYRPDNSRDVDRYRADLLGELEKPRGEIRILAVAGREFLFRNAGFAAKTLEGILNPKSKNYHPSVSLKVLLLHPCSEPAVSRGLREHPDCDFESFEETDLWIDIKKSCITLCDWKKKNYNVEARLYKVSSACFMVFVNNILFIEFYQFGAGGRASGKVPLMKISSTSELYDELKGHFDYVWDTASCFELNDRLLAQIEHPGATKDPSFVENIHFSRPDLFGSKPGNSPIDPGGN